MGSKRFELLVSHGETDCTLCPLGMVSYRNLPTGVEFPEVWATTKSLNLNRSELIKRLIKLVFLMLITLALGNATPAHIYKSFPPSHKVEALSAEKKTVPSEPKAAETPPPSVQTETPVAAPVAEPAPPPISGIVANCGDNGYAHYIYMHESGCNTNALNSIGCYGIGQSCPASKIAHCGADYACQNQWFSDYAIRAYGGWAGAYAFWTSHNWW